MFRAEQARGFDSIALAQSEYTFERVRLPQEVGSL